jgi:hypothetical protein
LIKKKQADENRIGNGNGTVTDIFLPSIESENEVDHEIWTEDNGALCHYYNDN